MRTIFALLLVFALFQAGTLPAASQEGGIRFQKLTVLNAENLREVKKLPLGTRAALKVEFLPMIGTAPSWFDHALKVRGPGDYRRTVERTSGGGTGRHTVEWLLPKDLFPVEGDYVLVLMINGDFSDPVELKIVHGREGGGFPEDLKIQILTPQEDESIDDTARKETVSMEAESGRRGDRIWVRLEISEGDVYYPPWNGSKPKAHWFIEDAGDDQWVLSDDFSCRIKTPADWEIIEGSSPGWMSRLTLRPKGEDTTLHWLVRPLRGGENRQSIRSSYEQSARFSSRDVKVWAADKDRVDSSTALIVDYDPREGFGDMNAAYFTHEGYAMVFEGVAGEDGFVRSESIFSNALEAIRLD